MSRYGWVMKHIFVVNPQAGGRDHTASIAARLQQMEADTELYRTERALDATRYVAQWCDDHPGVAVRFYACGGDGTLNEVVGGAVGREGVAVGCLPCGSGNDFVRYWPDRDFHDVKALVEGQPVKVDVMEIRSSLSTRYCLNTLNFGFEAAVCHTMAAVRRKPLVGGPLAYTTGIVASLATSRRNRCRITVDGEPWLSEPLLLASLANGRYAGGGYLCAPRAVNDDGMMEVMAIRPMSVVRFAKMIDCYKKGEHLDREELRDVVCYRRGHQVTFEDEQPFLLATDGEMMRDRRFEVRTLHQAVTMIVPTKQVR